MRGRRVLQLNHGVGRWQRRFAPEAPGGPPGAGHQSFLHERRTLFGIAHREDAKVVQVGVNWRHSQTRKTNAAKAAQVYTFPNLQPGAELHKISIMFAYRKSNLHIIYGCRKGN